MQKDVSYTTKTLDMFLFKNVSNCRQGEWQDFIFTYGVKKNQNMYNFQAFVFSAFGFS